MASKIQERASIKTKYDSIKWVLFGIFTIIYFGIKEDYPWSAILFIAAFVIILHLINVGREKELEKYK